MMEIIQKNSSIPLTEIVKVQRESVFFRHQNAVLLSTAHQCPILNIELQKKQPNTTIPTNRLRSHSNKYHPLRMDISYKHTFIPGRDKKSCPLACNAMVSSAAGFGPAHTVIK
jgi:hypothetical protein